MAQFDLAQYLSNGIEGIVKEAIKATFKNPKESAFLAKFALSAKKAASVREDFEKKGEHIPPFIIASITTACNLHCEGCYARASNHPNIVTNTQLSEPQWSAVFNEASKLGISFILLAGGEPLMRPNIIKLASTIHNIIFPIFTNGTMINQNYLELFDEHRNLIPIISLEGDIVITDNRRGDGVYQIIMEKAKELSDKGILFGASITVTNRNLLVVTDKAFLNDLYSKGFKVIFFIEYVPAEQSLKDLVLSSEEREYLADKLDDIRSCCDAVIISFPGDEFASGGCLAAGRGFFHINSYGGAEPCPFSPFSDINVKDNSLRDVLKSPLFKRLQSSDILMQSHEGGCVLFGKEKTVKGLMIDEAPVSI